MTSMQEALTEALEHPIAEPRRPSRSTKKNDKSERSRQQVERFPSSLLWGLLGSAVGSLLVYGVYRSFWKVPAKRRPLAGWM